MTPRQGFRDTSGALPTRKERITEIIHILAFSKTELQLRARVCVHMTARARFSDFSNLEAASVNHVTMKPWIANKLKLK